MKQYNIDEYIQKSKEMKNTSAGGSPAYHFEDGVVLVCYHNLSRYGLARPEEEQVAMEANKKNAKGVRTPAHLVIKREEQGEENFCYVLQETAPGVTFDVYNAYNNDCKKQLELQEKLLNAPDLHYEKCIQDLCELWHMGLELKTKNIYYDDDLEKGGFTFIDLLEYDPTPLSPNSIADVNWLSKYIMTIYRSTMITKYSHPDSTEEERKKSQELFYRMVAKNFQIMERTIPNFSQFRRWILRTMPLDLLEVMKTSGVEVGNLELTDQELQQFSEFAKVIVKESLEKIATGKNTYWQILVNETRISLDAMGMFEACKYQKDNLRRALLLNGSEKDGWEFDRQIREGLETKVNAIFKLQLEKIAKESKNPNILSAKEAMDEENSQQERKKGK